jgi:hypothetical protein
MMDDEDKTEDPKVVSIRDGKPSDRTYERTIIANDRRYSPQACNHRGPFIVDRKLGTVECGDCGASLNPIYVLEVLACGEAYWTMRQRDLSKYLSEINKEIEGRTRTRCTHCGNMTAIRFKKEIPHTWAPQPY